MKNSLRLLFIFITAMFVVIACAENKNQASNDTQTVSSPSLRQMSLPKGWTLKVIPAEYKMIEDKVAVKASDEWVTIPAEYKWVDGEIEGYDIHEPLPNTITKPAVYKTVKEIKVVQKAYIRLSVIPAAINDKGALINPAKVVEEHVPAVTKEVHRRVIKTPAAPVEPAEYARIIESLKTPHLIDNGRTRILVKPAQTFKSEIPPILKTETRRIRIQNETYALYDEYGELVAVIKNFDELTAARKTHP